MKQKSLKQGMDAHTEEYYQEEGRTYINVLERLLAFRMRYTFEKRATSLLDMDCCQVEAMKQVDCNAIFCRHIDDNDILVCPNASTVLSNQVVSELSPTVKKPAVENRQLRELRDELEAINRQLQDTQAEVEWLRAHSQTPQSEKETKLNQSLTFKSILEYIKRRGLYPFCNQILELLKDMCAMAGAQEEYQQVLEVQQQMINACLPKVINHNQMPESNVFLGNVYNPKFQTMNNGNG